MNNAPQLLAVLALVLALATFFTAIPLAVAVIVLCVAVLIPAS